MVATTHTVSLQGAIGHVVDVQVDLSDGLIGTSLVGRPDASITEARDRCRAAVNNSMFTWPNTRRTTILLSPADLPKRGPHFDLAIAVAVLAAADKNFPRTSLEGAAMIGELTLDGRIRCVPGVLPMTMAAAARGIDTVYVPEPQTGEAAMVPGMRVFGIRSLRQVVALLNHEEVPDAPEVEALSGSPLLSWRGEERLEDLDMADVLGMADARYAVEVAAAGGHHLMLTGPKGSGKTTLAERIPGLLPDLTDDESFELTAVHSLCGTLPSGASRITRPPFRAPHHSASRTGILGGGSGRVRPGEVSKAHLGVLFLDEFPLFPTDVVEALREPLEAGEISISRGEEDATYPARAMFVFACNPCRCGAYHPYSRDHQCTCTEVKRREYRRKISGPIADRMDITRFVEPVSRQQRMAGVLPFERPEPSASIRLRVAGARQRQRQRYAEHPWRLNAHAPGPMLREHWPLAEGAELRLETEVYSGRLTRRGAVRVHRVAWSVADLAGIERPGVDELDVALRLRSATPLLVSSLPSSRGEACTGSDPT
jgi:magnesium chelatase family protein